MRVAVGLLEGAPSVEVELAGEFQDAGGRRLPPGRHTLASETTLTPADADRCSFALDEMTIGIGFHWERKERQVFRGALRTLRRGGGLTAINDVDLEEYVTSVISSEMSAASPLELLKAHAVISRSWLKGPLPAVPSPEPTPGEIRRWYGREAHAGFEVCADDHCQRYQGITKAHTPAASEAVRATKGEVLSHAGAVCDARFSKCCGGLTERYATAWDDRDVPYLVCVPDGPPHRGSSFAAGAPPPEPDGSVGVGSFASAPDAESWIRSSPPAYCNTRDAALLARVLPGFDQETPDFYRWTVSYAPEELGELVTSRLGVDLGRMVEVVPLARGPSGRIHRLRLTGERGEVVVGKELEIRRALSRSHLLSSAFVVDRDGDRFVLHGAGWGHGVGLCQIGAAVMAAKGTVYRDILAHYYPATGVTRLES